MPSSGRSCHGGGSRTMRRGCRCSPGVPPGQLPAATGAAQADPGLDADDAAREVDPDRGQGREALEVLPLLVGGSRRATAVVRPDAGADRPLVPRLCLGLRLGRCGNRVPKASPGVHAAQRGAFSRSPCQRKARHGPPGPCRERSGVRGADAMGVVLASALSMTNNSGGGFGDGDPQRQHTHIFIAGPPSIFGAGARLGGARKCPSTGRQQAMTEDESPQRQSLAYGGWPVSLTLREPATACSPEANPNAMLPLADWLSSRARDECSSACASRPS
jgi:hypothetical protein